MLFSFKNILIQKYSNIFTLLFLFSKISSVAMWKKIIIVDKMGMGKYFLAFFTFTVIYESIFIVVSWNKESFSFGSYFSEKKIFQLRA